MSPNRTEYLATVVNLFQWAISLPHLSDRERGLARGALHAAGTDSLREWGEANPHRKDEFRALLSKLKGLLNAK